MAMSLTIPEDILRAANMSAVELQREIALLLFQQDKLTLGQASTFAGMSQLEFQRLLASRQIPVHYDVREFTDDLNTLRTMGQL
jgi:predicted HTH domain antitoxin